MNILRGIGMPPLTTATARAIVEAALMAAVVAALAVWVSFESAAVATPAILAIGRIVEGVIDQIDPAKKRAPAGDSLTNGGSVTVLPPGAP